MYGPSDDHRTLGLPRGVRNYSIWCQADRTGNRIAESIYSMIVKTVCLTYYTVSE